MEERKRAETKRDCIYRHIYLHVKQSTQQWHLLTLTVSLAALCGVMFLELPSLLMESLFTVVHFWAWRRSDHASVWLEWALAHWCPSTCLDGECAGTTAACIHECPYLTNREVCGEGKVLVMCGRESVGYIVVYLRQTHADYSYYHKPHCYRSTDSQYTNTLPVAGILIQVIFKTKYH